MWAYTFDQVFSCLFFEYIFELRFKSLKHKLIKIIKCIWKTINWWLTCVRFPDFRSFIFGLTDEMQGGGRNQTCERPWETKIMNWLQHQLVTSMRWTEIMLRNVFWICKHLNRARIQCLYVCVCQRWLNKKQNTKMHFQKCYIWLNSDWAHWISKQDPK